MIEKYSVRTDLALEEKERFESDNVEIQGVVLEEEYDEQCEMRITRVKVETENGAKVMGKPVGKYLTLEAPNLAVPDEDYHREISLKLAGITRVKVETENGAKVMGKPVGKYLTLEAPNLAVPDEDYHREISLKLAEYLKELIGKEILEQEELSILVIGLGNREVTPDALGPYVAEQVCVTRHIVKEYGKYAMGMERVKSVSAVVPGVMGQTGMESQEIVKGIVKETGPDLVIAVDALAARNSRRLNRTIQIADTGIHPGSGVGNHRNGLTRETLGIPVIAIGVPTVVDAATIVNDTMENFIEALESSKMLKGVGDVLKTYSNAEKYEMVKELISPHLNGMFVTPKDEDEMVKQISYTISEALNVLLTDSEQGQAV